MIILLSPAKTLDFESPAPRFATSEPRFLSKSGELATVLKKKTTGDLRKLMSISEELAELNYQRYQVWGSSDPNDMRPAINAFQGDVYQGLQASEWNAAQRKEAQKNLRILSGLYGLLRPLDAMLPYRLEMGTRLKTKAGKDLYEFWGDRLAEMINSDAEAAKAQAIVNLASQEYFKAARPKLLELPVISPVFKDLSNGKYRVISFFAKKARGQMADWIIRKKAKSAGDLAEFCEDGYQWQEQESLENKPVFHRDAAPAN